MKKFLSLLLSVALLVGACGSALAASPIRWIPGSTGMAPALCRCCAAGSWRSGRCSGIIRIMAIRAPAPARRC